MDDDVFSGFYLNSHGFHEPKTCCQAVAGLHVNVLAPQTLRAVVRIAVPANKETAPFTGEIFLGTLEISSTGIHSFSPRM